MYKRQVYELFILTESRKYVHLSNNQFGGEPGVSSTHFLCTVWNQVTEHLEDNRAGVTLAAVNYSKAFNRLEHLPCLQALARLGMPTELLQILGSFLHGRRMTVRVRSSNSKPRLVNRRPGLRLCRKAIDSGEGRLRSVCLHCHLNSREEQPPVPPMHAVPNAGSWGPAC